jgi:adenylosuccinate lyase
MSVQSLTAISPVDGRYHKQTSALGDYFSEYALMKYRVRVEIEYFIALCEHPVPGLPALKAPHLTALRGIWQHFTVQHAEEIKEIEKTTNHDVKAVEYFIKKHLEIPELQAAMEFIHFGLTSQDINNTAIPLSLKEASRAVLLPELHTVIKIVQHQSIEWQDVPMLARTHGQAASPTRLGKEWMVFIHRLEGQLKLLQAIPFSAKFGGATGNFNAHLAAYPEIEWLAFANQFVQENLGLSRTQVTTQIEPYDNLAAYCDGLKRINTILIDFSRDVWHYVSINYFKQKIKAGEVGSSAMPHKVNPIDFENAEGNLGIANALLEHFSAKLPISRLQRDLTDSTVLRNLGVPLAHMLVAFKSLEKGLNKLELNQAALEADLEAAWPVVAEGIQTILRREGIANPYEQLRDLTRKNERIGQKEMHDFIEGLPVSEAVKTELKALSPSNYTGIKL